MLPPHPVTAPFPPSPALSYSRTIERILDCIRRAGLSVADREIDRINIFTCVHVHVLRTSDSDINLQRTNSADLATFDADRHRRS